MEMLDGNETPIPNQGQRSLAKIHGILIVYELQLSNSRRQKYKKQYTDVFFGLDTSYSSKNTTSKNDNNTANNQSKSWDSFYYGSYWRDTLYDAKN